jgi:protein-S-isoprenylcysteine O-methyltransferase Ste14
VLYWFIVELVNSAIGARVQLLPPAYAYIVTGLCWTIGLFWILWAYSYLVFIGGGSPVEAFGFALEPTQSLVTTGPYAYVRNPLVVGLLFILLGVGFISDSIAGILLAPVVGLLIASYLVLFEEKHLIRRFGEGYVHYREHVPMIIPRAAPYMPVEEKKA